MGGGEAGKSYVLHRFFFSAAHDGSRFCALIRGFLFTPQKAKGTVCRQRWPFVAPSASRCVTLNFAQKKKKKQLTAECRLHFNAKIQRSKPPTLSHPPSHNHPTPSALPPQPRADSQLLPLKRPKSPPHPSPPPPPPLSYSLPMESR